MFNKQSISRFIIVNSIYLLLIPANANCHKNLLKPNVNPYIGIDYKLSYTKGYDYWKKLLPTTKIFQHGSLFAGVRFHSLVSGEFGYTQSGKISKYSDVSRISMWNIVAYNGTVQKIKLNFNSWHMDVNLQYPSEKFSVLLTIGAASTRAKILAANLGVATNNLIENIIGKSKIVPRLGIGVQYTSGMFGVRSRVIFENNSRLRLDSPGVNNIFPNITEKPFKNTYLWNLGMFLNL